MLRYIIIIAICLVVGAAMAFILWWFLRKLAKIEEERWGKKVEIHPATAAQKGKPPAKAG